MRRGGGAPGRREEAGLRRTPGRGRACAVEACGAREAARISLRRGRSPRVGGLSRGLGGGEGGRGSWQEEEGLTHGPFPSAKASSPSPPPAASTMFFTCGPNEAMVVSGKSGPGQGHPPSKTPRPSPAPLNLISAPSSLQPPPSLNLCPRWPQNTCDSRPCFPRPRMLALSSQTPRERSAL